MATKSARKFGTAPVFFTAISTILGAVMFLRFGFAVGNVGFVGTLAIIIIAATLFASHAALFHCIDLTPVIV